MTYELLGKIIDKHNIPKNVHLLSDSGWECDETEMNGIFFNKEKNELVFTQGNETYTDRKYTDENGWLHIWSDTNKEQERERMMKQTIRNLTTREIEELSRNGGRVVQVISHKTQERKIPTSNPFAPLSEFVEHYLCLIQEREEQI